ncbi:MAG: hypothetical protein ACHREM_20125 [Polyangiales bacterium]
MSIGTDHHQTLVAEIEEVTGRDPWSWAVQRTEGIARIAGEALFEARDADRETRMGASDALLAIADLAKIARTVADHRRVVDSYSEQKSRAGSR